MNLLPRGIQPAVAAAWRGAAVVQLDGPRGAGKTTLAKLVTPNYYSLADPATRELALQDLRGWLEGLPFGSVVDEFQLIPNVRLTMKLIVDERTATPGQFLLTGSAHVPDNELGGSAALVGRQRSFRVEPFAQCELDGTPRDALSALFDGEPREFSLAPVPHAEFIRRFAVGGLPTLRSLSADEPGNAIDSYVRALFSADVRPTGRDTDSLLRAFAAFVADSSKLENISQLAQRLEISRDTVRAYLDEFLSVYMVVDAPAYRSDPAKRVTEKRRLYANDPVFVAHQHAIAQKSSLFAQDGPFVETAVFNEISRLRNWTRLQDVRLNHWRMKDTHEVDIVVHRADGKAIAIEVKAARSVGLDAAKGIRAFRAEYPEQFHRGYVLHCGDHATRLEDGIWALPFSALWMLGDPVVAAPKLDFASRLKDARDAILLRDNQVSAAAVARRVEMGTRHFEDVEETLHAVSETFIAVGVRSEVSHLDFDTVSGAMAATTWYFKASMTVTFATNEWTLRWKVSGVGVGPAMHWSFDLQIGGSPQLPTSVTDAMQGSVELPVEVSPIEEVQRRLLPLIDELPKLIDALRRP